MHTYAWLTAATVYPVTTREQDNLNRLMNNSNSVIMTHHNATGLDVEQSTDDKQDETIQLTLAQVHAFTAETTRSDANDE